MRAVLRLAVVQCVPEVLRAPCADPGFAVGRDVRAEHRAERRVDRNAARVGRAATHRVAAVAVRGAREILAGRRLSGAFIFARRRNAALHRQRPRTGRQWPRLVRGGEAAEPRRNGGDVFGRKARRDLAHAVRLESLALADAPRAHLRSDVLARESDEPRNRGLHAVRRIAMACRARRQITRGIALRRECSSARGYLRRRPCWRRIRRIEALVVLADLAQVIVREVRDEVIHDRIAPLELAERDELIEEISRRLSRQARVVLRLCQSLASLTVAHRASFEPLLEGVVYGRGFGGQQRGGKEHARAFHRSPTRAASSHCPEAVSWRSTNMRPSSTFTLKYRCSGSSQRSRISSTANRRSPRVKARGSSSPRYPAWHSTRMFIEARILGRSPANARHARSAGMPSGARALLDHRISVRQDCRPGTT